MDEAVLMSYAMKALTLSLFLSAPTMVVAVVVGLAVGLFQSVTQIQDSTLPFAVKLAAATIVLILTAQWGSALMMQFGLNCFNEFTRLG